MPGETTGGTGDPEERPLEEILRSAVYTFSEARRAARAAKNDDVFAMSQELDDVLTCESWGISQAVLDAMSEEEIMMRKLTEYARYIEGKA